MSYTRKYVTLKNDYYEDDPDNASKTITGVVYFEGAEPSELFYENLNIEEVNLTDPRYDTGRWMLLLGNACWVDDDFEKLERLLLEWAGDEGYEIQKTYGPIDF